MGRNRQSLILQHASVGDLLFSRFIEVKLSVKAQILSEDISDVSIVNLDLVPYKVGSLLKGRPTEWANTGHCQESDGIMLTAMLGGLGFLKLVFSEMGIFRFSVALG